MKPEGNWKVWGNDSVIQLLESVLVEARKGNLGYIGIFGGSYPDIKSFGYGGISDLERIGLEAQKGLMKEIRKCKRDRTVPKSRKTPRADFVTYNVVDGPIGWDYLIWLIDAEMTRVKEGAPAPLKVNFFFGRAGVLPLNPDQERMIANVFRPLLPLIGAVEGFDGWGRSKRVFVLRDVVDMAAEGVPLPVLCASALARQTVNSWFKHDEHPVTITLREAKHWPHRNSNIDAWVRIAKELEADGERVVVIRDTDMLDQPLFGLTLCPAASLNVDVRLALYERAKVNLCVSNGPCGLLLFGLKPYLYFQQVDEKDAHMPNRPGFWEAANHIPTYGQMPWANKLQRMIWKPDSYETIRAAWGEMKPKLDAALPASSGARMTGEMPAGAL